MMWERKRRALDAWRGILERPVSWAEAEERYHELLISADAMEKEGLISEDEWRKLAQQAGKALASTAECMGGTRH